MKEEKIFETIGNIDDKYIQEIEFNKKKNYVWVKYVMAAACFCLVICAAIVGTLHFKNNAASNGSDAVPAKDENGIFIPAITLPKQSDGAEYDMLACVVYKDGIYTQAESFYGADAERIKPLVGKYIGYATGSINEWSTQKDYAKEFASSVNGDVYEVKGYDSDFRICIKNEDDEKYQYIMFLERLNGITLKTGADLFEKKLHFSDSIVQIDYQTHDEWNASAAEYHTAEIDETIWNKFMEQADKNEFEYLWDSKNISNTIYDTQNQVHLVLTMSDGTKNRIRLIEGGYVGYDYMGWYFVKIPDEIFNAVFSLVQAIK